MITRDNLPEVLRSLGFTENKNIWTKSYPTGASITVDFNTKKINYAPLDATFSNGDYPTKDKPATGFVIHRDTTINFEHNENFVCLVCVHLLLKKGYEAKHIVFEPAFKVGHVNKPSYGDILVFDKKYIPLVLIENKTFGTEFSKEWNLMQKDGGQLFSYLGPLVNEMGLCQNLVLFAADFDNKELIIKNHIITLKDNEKRIKELENASTFANTQGKYFEVWDQTYGKSFETKGLLEEDIAAYSVGKLKYTIKDLKGLSHAEIRPIYHEFATILRNHAITDFEHSFYILIDLFLCKITDELNNPDDLQFYYKGIARDTPKEYCNRLLKLYQMGKQQLFNVNVVNKDEEDIRQIFDDTNRSLYNGLFDGIKELFEEMKFYNIKKFNFIDVENKEEFEMNFKILIKIAALIQDINLSSSETNHFFGDLFEGLLSKNVHQTEGQFFTPLPIVNFIIKSLPQFPNTDKIKVLDYACGAGHFLTEFVKHYPKAKIYGIEKSQTLSQVAKIATIINGSQDSHIIFKDSLGIMNTMNVRFQGFDKDSFDCIIANPPYSVTGFLNTLEQKDREQFELSSFVDEKAYPTNKSIECFFVERATHFLKKGGLMGIILPSSLLSNENIYTKTRELIFANFNILGIAAMNSRTFGSTGTNTIILFAQKVKKNSEGLLQTFMKKKDYTQYTTSDAIDAYVQKQGYPKDEFFSFMQDNVLNDVLKSTVIFKDYISNFKKTKIAKGLQKEWFAASSYYRHDMKENSKAYKELFKQFLACDSYLEQEKAEHHRQFVAFAKDIESRKLRVFIQIYNNNVAILQSPPEKIDDKSNKAEVIRFLGYDWSNRKGYEGIKYVTNQVIDIDNSDSEDDKDKEIVQAINSIKYIETPLYNPDNADDKTKFAYALRKHITDNCNNFSFGTAVRTLDEAFSGEMDGLLQYANLTDLIKFDRTAFSLAIQTSVEKKTELFEYKFPTKRLEQILVRVDGSTTKIAKEKIKTQGSIPVVSQESGNLIAGYTDNESAITDLPLIVFGDHSCTFKYVDFEFVRGADGTQLLKTNRNEILSEFLYHFLLNIRIENAERYERHFKYLKNVLVPLPPKDLQLKIVVECQQIDDESHEAKDRINDLREEIKGIVTSVNGKNVKLGTIYEVSSGGTPSRKNIAFWTNGSIPWVTTTEVTNGIITSTNECITELGLQNSSARIYPKDSLIIAMYGQGATRGRTAKLGIDASTNQACAVLYKKKMEVETDFIWYYMQCQYEKLRNISHGSVRPNLNAEDIKNFEIKLPPLSEQKAVLTRIEKIEKEIASLREICDGAAARKKAVLSRELLEDDNITKETETSHTVAIHSYEQDNLIEAFEPLLAAEPFEIYNWNRFDQNIIDFFGGDKTILVGCYKGKKYLNWILSHNLYNIRLGKTKGSMEGNRALFGKTTLLLLYELNKPNKLSAYEIIGHQEMGKEELVALNYPTQSPRKSYMTFNIKPLDMNLEFIADHHLVEKLIEINPNNAKGTPVFIQP